MPDFKNVRKILVLKFRHIGDVLLIVPTIRALKETFPSASISVAVNAGTEEVISGNQLIDELIVFDRSVKKLPLLQKIAKELNFLKEIRQRRFDMTVDLTSGDRPAILSFLSGARYRLANDPGKDGFFGKRFCYSHIAHINDRIKHMVMQNLDIVNQFGIFSENKEVDFFINDETREKVRKLLEEKGIKRNDRIVHIHPLSRWTFKCWDDRYMAEITDWLCKEGMKVILTCAPNRGEMERAEKILSLLSADTQSSGNLIKLFGKTTIKELAAVSLASDIFFGVDSAPMHIAAAVKTPVIALFGPTGESTWGPYGEQHIVLSKDLSCKPCRKGMCEGVALRECMSAIKPEDVKKAVSEKIGQASGYI
jgi:heptosyltransferase-3